MELTKINELFRSDYMAWGLAEFDAEQRGKKAGYCEGLSDGISQGISQGEHQAKIETAKNLLTMGISIDVIAECTGLSVDEIKNSCNTITLHT